MSGANGRNRGYTDAEKATALATLASNGGNVNQTAGQLKIPRKTLANWAAGKVHPEVAKDGQEKKATLAELFTKIAYQALGVAEQKMDELDAREAVLTAAIATDKAQLLEGKPTEIVEGRDDERRARLRERYSSARLSDAGRRLFGEPVGQPVSPPGANGTASPVPDAGPP